MKRSACGPKADFADLFGCTELGTVPGTGGSLYGEGQTGGDQGEGEGEEEEHDDT